MVLQGWILPAPAAGTAGRTLGSSPRVSSDRDQPYGTTPPTRGATTLAQALFCHQWDFWDRFPAFGGGEEEQLQGHGDSPPCAARAVLERSRPRRPRWLFALEKKGKLGHASHPPALNPPTTPEPWCGGGSTLSSPSPVPNGDGPEMAAVPSLAHTQRRNRWSSQRSGGGCGRLYLQW